MSKILVIHENSEWPPPFAAALDYDINTNTNYNPVVEEEAGAPVRSGRRRPVSRSAGSVNSRPTG
mgnify:CR=1 FL=1